MRRAGLLAMLVAVPLGSSMVPIDSAAAAVRICGQPILGRMAQAPTELAARRGAITSWRSKAARLGRAYTSWRLALHKRYKCGRLSNGNFICVAFAAPCRIVQRPPFAHPRRKGKPLPAPRPGLRRPEAGERQI